MYFELRKQTAEDLNHLHSGARTLKKFQAKKLVKLNQINQFHEKFFPLKYSQKILKKNSVKLIISFHEFSARTLF